MGLNDKPASSAEAGAPILAVRKDSASALADTDGDFSFLQVDSTGALRTVGAGGGGGTEFDDGDAIDTDSQGTLLIGTTAVPGTARAVRTTDSGAVHISDGGGSITIDGTVSGTGTFTVTDDGNFTLAANSGVDIGDVDVLTLPNVAQPTHDNLNANANIQIGDTDVSASNPVPTVGNVANDGVDSGNPIKIGGIARTTNPTAVADADRVNAMFDKVGRQVMVLASPRALTTHATTTISTTTETTILAAGGAGVFHDVTQIVLSNTSQSSVRVDIRDATSGTIRLSVGLAPKGGAVIPFNVPLVQASANNNWRATLSTAVTDVRIFIQAVKNV